MQGDVCAHFSTGYFRGTCESWWDFTVSREILNCELDHQLSCPLEVSTLHVVVLFVGNDLATNLQYYVSARHVMATQQYRRQMSAHNCSCRFLLKQAFLAKSMSCTTRECQESLNIATIYHNINLV